MQSATDLILKEFVKRGHSIDGDTRVWNISDSKLWYLTPEQAQAFLSLEGSEKYRKGVRQREINLIENNAEDILEMVDGGDINIIDLGCGDGRKASLLINKLKERKANITYCPVDVSSHMVEIALERVKSFEGVSGVEWNVSDFDNLENISNLLRKEGNKKNVFLLLGSTLGDFEINELLYNIRSSMRDGDVLMIGNGIDNSEHDKVMNVYGDKSVDNFLIKILTCIGFSENDLEFNASFNNSRVEFYYNVKNNRKVSFREKNIEFKSGDKIIVAVSYKYKEDDFRSFMKMYFDENKIFLSGEGSYALALCRK
jgi:L-histidine Nalpha-methyltransferase